MQQLPFLPLPINATRRIVVSTNVAETSVTLPGVRYVVDCGLEKRKTYNGTTGVSCLTTTTITRASAMQRTGR
jgi:HrpA-like RNA helicase